ncbi:hypothetical protein [Planctomycetes bacterium Poly30]
MKYPDRPVLSSTLSPAVRVVALAALVVAVAGCGGPSDTDPATRLGSVPGRSMGPGECVFYDIGVVHRKVTTSSPEAELWFDRRLALSFGFNHE